MNHLLARQMIHMKCQALFSLSSFKNVVCCNFESSFKNNVRRLAKKSELTLCVSKNCRKSFSELITMLLSCIDMSAATQE